jgi:hypothetical protein
MKIRMFRSAEVSGAGLSPPKLGGVAVRSRRDAIATSVRTDGVVPNFLKREKTNSETPPGWLSRNFLWVAATSPDLGGVTR